MHRTKGDFVRRLSAQISQIIGASCESRGYDPLGGIPGGVPVLVDTGKGWLMKSGRGCVGRLVYCPLLGMP